jgi:pimeloyl-ACP methyl ester carboxylesterase
VQYFPVAVERMTRYERDGLVFDVRDEGPLDGPVVVLLHGFPETSASWSDVIPKLVDAGYRAVAPDQRGYSPDARPRGRRAYRRRELVADVLALIDQTGAERVHLVGHDWGAAVAWAVAMDHRNRLLTLTSLSIPHPAAFRRAALTSSQGFHSWYMGFFQIPLVPEALLRSGDWRRFHRNLIRSGLSPQYADRYVAVLRQPGALTAAINWYRGMRPYADSRPTRVSTPTLVIWGSRDAFVRPKGIRDTAQFVSGPYRLEVLDGVSHWIPEQVPDRVAELLGSHFASAPTEPSHAHHHRAAGE